MSIPDKPLVINLTDLDSLTLAENRLLYGERYVIDEFYQFLLDRVDHAESWTESEIGAITRGELAGVHAQVRAKLVEQATPLAK